MPSRLTRLSSTLHHITGRVPCEASRSTRPTSATQSPSSQLGKQRVPEQKSAPCLLHKGSPAAKQRCRPNRTARFVVQFSFQHQLPVLSPTDDKWQPVRGPRLEYQSDLCGPLHTACIYRPWQIEPFAMRRLKEFLQSLLLK